MDTQTDDAIQALVNPVPGLWRTKAGPYTLQTDIDFVVFPCCARSFKAGLLESVTRSTAFLPLFFWTYSRSSASLFLLEQSSERVVQLDFYLPTKDYAPYGLASSPACPSCICSEQVASTGGQVPVLPTALLDEYNRKKASYKEAQYNTAKRTTLGQRARRLRIDWGLGRALREFCRRRRVIVRKPTDQEARNLNVCATRKVFAYLPSGQKTFSQVVSNLVLWIFRRRPMVVESRLCRRELTDADVFSWLKKLSLLGLKKWA